MRDKFLIEKESNFENTYWKEKFMKGKLSPCKHDLKQWEHLKRLADIGAFNILARANTKWQPCKK